METYTSFTEDGIIIGRREGWREGTIEAALKLLTRRLGALGQAAQKRISRLSPEQLDELFDAAFDFEKKAELDDWLRKHAAVRSAAIS